MGTIPDYRLCVAPAFYNSQVDICGAVNAYSKVGNNKDMAGGLLLFHNWSHRHMVMEDYSSSSFITAFIRCVCRVGYLKLLMPDARRVQGSVQNMHGWRPLYPRLHGVESSTNTFLSYNGKLWGSR